MSDNILRVSNIDAMVNTIKTHVEEINHTNEEIKNLAEEKVNELVSSGTLQSQIITDKSINASTKIINGSITRELLDPSISFEGGSGVSEEEIKNLAEEKVNELVSSGTLQSQIITDKSINASTKIMNGSITKELLDDNIKLDIGEVGSQLDSVKANVKEISSQIDENAKYMHLYKLVNFSIDDFYISLKDITDNSSIYNSIFENTTFNFLKELHDNYGAIVTLNLYEVDSNYNVSNVTTKFKKEFEENSNWLKFTWHTHAATTDYSVVSAENMANSLMNTKKAVINFAGEKSWSNVVRLNYFKGTDNIIKKMKDLGIIGVLTADDDRISCGLQEDENNYLKTKGILFKNNMTYLKTYMRYEKIGTDYTIDEKLLELKNVYYFATFTHENYLSRTTIKNYIKQSFEWIVKNGYKFTTYEDLSMLIYMYNVASYSKNIVRNKIDCPSNVNIDNTTLKWDKVENALSYNVYCNNILLGNTLDLTFDLSGIKSAGNNAIQVASIADGIIYKENSDLSEKIIYHVISDTPDTPDISDKESITYEKGTLAPMTGRDSDGVTHTVIQLRNNVKGRARSSCFIKCTKGTFNILDSATYNLSVLECSDTLTRTINTNITGEGDVLAGGKSWVSTYSITNKECKFIKLMFKKLDETEFTIDEINNMSNLFTYTTT